MLTSKTLRNAAVVLIVAGMTGACANKDASKSGVGVVARTAADSASPAATTSTGPVSFAGVTREDGSDMSDAELAGDIANFPALGDALKALSGATSASISGNIITLSDANGLLATIKTDGNSVTSTPSLPISAVMIEKMSNMPDSDIAIHFRLKASKPATDAAASSSSTTPGATDSAARANDVGFNVALVMDGHQRHDSGTSGANSGDRGGFFGQNIDRTHGNGQGMGQGQGQSQQQQQQQVIPQPKQAPLPSPQPKQAPLPPPQSKQAPLPPVQSKVAPLPSPQPKEVQTQVQSKQVQVQAKQVQQQQVQAKQVQVQAKQVQVQAKQVQTQSKQVQTQSKQIPSQSKQVPSQSKTTTISKK